MMTDIVQCEDTHKPLMNLYKTNHGRILSEQPVLMDPKETNMHTILIEENGMLVSAWGKETVEQLKEQNPKLEQITFEDAIGLIDSNLEKRYDKGWEEIPENIWWEMLEVLPPESWGNVSLPGLPSRHPVEIEMFRMSEYQEGEYTQHFACITKEQRFYSKVCSSHIPMKEHAISLQEQFTIGEPLVSN